MQWVILLLFCGFVQANTDGTVFLERGHRGIVPCPLVESRKILPGDVNAMYWYYGSIMDTSLLISYFLGRVAPQNGIPEGVYDIDDEFNLIIENVTASNEGTYFFQVKPHLKMIEEGQVEVCDEGLLQPTVRVIGCDNDIDLEDMCETKVQRDTKVLNLTCVTEHVKPAVELRWIRLLGDGLTELNASTTVRPVVLPAYTGSSYMSNTHSRSVSIQVPAVDDDTEYVCQAIDVTEGGGAHMKVRFTKTNPTTATYDEVQTSNNPGVCIQANTDGIVFLERGHRGIVPCPLVKSRQISRENVDAMYWYYDTISGTSLLISYFSGRGAPQNGIPEGVYDIDDEFSLVIENVTASNEGNYYFQLKPRLKMIESGQVGVCEKVSPSRPYPTVIGCNQDHDADKCEVRVRHDSTVHNLTCVMEQVKPAVDLKWIRLLGGKTELNASATVNRHVVPPAYTGSSLRNNTYSTSASVQLAAADEEEVFECEAMGVAVGGNTGMRVRLTKTHPTTAAYDTTATYDTMATYNKNQSSNNPETTLDLAHKVSPTTCKPAGQPSDVIALEVGISILVTIILLMYVRIIYLRKKLKKDKRASKTRILDWVNSAEGIYYSTVCTLGTRSSGSSRTTDDGIGDCV